MSNRIRLDGASARNLLSGWERIFLASDPDDKALITAFHRVEAYLMRVPDELEVNASGHISPALQRAIALTSRGRRALGRTEPPSPDEANAIQFINTLLTAERSGLPSIEERYSVFVSREQLDAPEGWFESPWSWRTRRLLHIITSKEEGQALVEDLENGVVIGYDLETREETRQVNVHPLYRRIVPAERKRTFIEGVTFTVEASDDVRTRVEAVFEELIEPLLECERFLAMYRLRTVSSALMSSVVIAAPFVVLGYFADFYILPVVVGIGVTGIMWKVLEITIRYMEGNLDTLMQYRQMRIECEKGGVGEEEVAAARMGVFASVSGPVLAIASPAVGVVESSVGYSVTAAANATSDNFSSAVQKARSDWYNEKAFGSTQTRTRNIVLDMYVTGNILGSFTILFSDVGARRVLAPGLFEFLRIVSWEGFVLGMMDSEVATILTKVMIVYQKKKWMRRFDQHLV